MHAAGPDSHPPYTAEYCEREYNARAMIPDHPRIFADWAERGAATRRQRAGLLDLPYGEAAAERLDLFPTRRESAPLLVYIHGGYWRSLDKSDFSWVAPPFVDHGIAVAVVNYGLAPGTPIEEMVRQMLRALAWLYRKADDLGFDPQRMHVAGHSAGGHLAAMMLAALWPRYDEDLPEDLVKGVLGVSGSCTRRSSTSTCSSMSSAPPPSRPRECCRPPRRRSTSRSAATSRSSSSARARCSPSAGAATSRATCRWRGSITSPSAASSPTRRARSSMQRWS
jgi:acetyl esterase/lipase